MGGRRLTRRVPQGYSARRVSSMNTVATCQPSPRVSAEFAPLPDDHGHQRFRLPAQHTASLTGPSTTVPATTTSWRLRSRSSQDVRQPSGLTAPFWTRECFVMTTDTGAPADRHVLTPQLPLGPGGSPANTTDDSRTSLTRDAWSPLLRHPTEGRAPRHDPSGVGSQD